MSEPIQPALTAEEWTGLAIDRDSLGARIYRERLTTAGGTLGSSDRHALAALALYGQPFGFTREDVHALRLASRRYGDGSQRQAGLLSLADRIEALLPPEKPT